MGGPNLEVFKFATYVFLPILVMAHFGNPEWYQKNVLPYKDKIFPPEENLVRNLPNDQVTLREELARIKAERLAAKAQRERQAAEAAAKHL
ncbi:hypothetical protein PsYK624_029190 [Phanerochaete sordida]|uniref:Uncharacterized protein n=1 Tax=Phanerochaete sordida TaxID=48140 RepID=A0A9P3G238_9APHY|nr:hypothetical protein PsYK624_029190 [Phanerochaete sordida]